MTNFKGGFAVGFFTMLAAAIIYTLISGQVADTTTGQIRTSPVQAQITPLQAAIVKAAVSSSKQPVCPRSGEFTLFVNEMVDKLNSERDPRNVSVSQLRSIYRRFNTDSMINPKGYELFDLVDPIYEKCTGLAAPVTGIRLEDGYLRYTCFNDTNNKVSSRIVIGHESESVLKVCE